MDVAKIMDPCDRALADIDEVWLLLPLRVEDAEASLRRLLGDPDDFSVRALGGGVRAVFLAALIDLKLLEAALLQLPAQDGSAPRDAFSAQASPLRTYGDVAAALLQSKVVLLSPSGRAEALSLERQVKRQPEEPPSEIVPQGPHLGFIESLDHNLVLLRQLIPDRHLRWERVTLATRQHTSAALVYVDGLIRPDLLRRVRDRLGRAQPSLLTDAAMLQEWLSNRSGILFPTIESTERPDTVAAAVLEGRAAILVDGSPVALLIPTVFGNLVQTPQDYYNRASDAVAKRVLRLGAFAATLLLAPLLVALATVNQELIPAPVYVSISQSRLDTPLPLLLEVLAMEAIVELVREAGLRMPSAVGQTISIVGATIIGQAAVAAGLVSAPVVVVVALEYIASTVVPSLDTRIALRLLRLPLILLAAALGIFGIFWGLLLLLIYLAALQSFGVPYLAPLAPRRGRGLQDTIYRAPLTDMRRSFFARRP